MNHSKKTSVPGLSLTKQFCMVTTCLQLLTHHMPLDFVTKMISGPQIFI
jgi:hypothetical protein